MNKIATFVVLAAVATGCGDDQSPAESAELYDRIMSENYRNFATAPGYESRQPSNAPHSDQTQVFVNDVVKDALDAGEPITSWPVGSLIVKDGFEDDGDHDLIAAMEKRDDGWFWAEWLDPSSSDSDFSGKPDICIDCHNSGSDFVLAFGFPGGS